MQQNAGPFQRMLCIKEEGIQLSLFHAHHELSGRAGECTTNLATVLPARPAHDAGVEDAIGSEVIVRSLYERIVQLDPDNHPEVRREGCPEAMGRSVCAVPCGGAIIADADMVVVVIILVVTIIQVSTGIINAMSCS